MFEAWRVYVNVPTAGSGALLEEKAAQAVSGTRRMPESPRRLSQADGILGIRKQIISRRVRTPRRVQILVPNMQ